MDDYSPYDLGLTTKWDNNYTPPNPDYDESMEEDLRSFKKIAENILNWQLNFQTYKNVITPLDIGEIIYLTGTIDDNSIILTANPVQTQYYKGVPRTKFMTSLVKTCMCLNLGDTIALKIVGFEKNGATVKCITLKSDKNIKGIVFFENPSITQPVIPPGVDRFLRWVNATQEYMLARSRELGI